MDAKTSRRPFAGTSPEMNTTSTTANTSSTAPPTAAMTTTPGAAQVSTQGAAALRDIACGSVAGAAGKIVEYPFDTVKVRLQAQPDRLPLRYAGPLDCLRQSLRRDGVRGLYRGISAPMVGAAAETACLFWTYRVAQDVLRTMTAPAAATVSSGAGGGEAAVFAKETGRVEELAAVEAELPLPTLVAAGAISGGLTSLVLTPIELVKCRMQVYASSVEGGVAGSRSHSASPFAVIADVYRREGLRGFWRGQLGTLLRETGGSAAWFGSYEALSKYFKSRLPDPANDSMPIWQRMTAGAIAGMGYNFAFYPADTIKSKIQTGELTHVRPTFMNVGRELWNAHGLKGLYRGCGITVARSAPSSALIFTIYEALKKSIW